MSRTQKITVLVAALACLPALAQEPPEGEEDRGGGLMMEEIVVTGSASNTQVTKFDTSYAISTFNDQDIAEKAPLNTADMLSEIPGFWAESSGGETGNNLFARGIPADGSFRYSPLHEDGLPVFEEAEVAFMNADTLVRIDETIERIEVVRGGPASIYASNAPGGIVNFITRKGTENFEGVAKLTLGDYEHIRTDLHFSGPLSDRVLYSIGGFYRVDNGIRDPGFTANDGGQVRAGLTFLLDDGEINVNVKHLNEKNIFYLPIPLIDPSDPDSIPGLDANEGTLTSNDFRVVNLKDPEGGRIADMADGINPTTTTLTGSLDLDIGNGWTLTDRFRFIDGDLTFNAGFSLTEPNDAQQFLDDNRATVLAAFPGATDVVYRFTNSSATFDPATANGNGLVISVGWWNQELEYSNFINDLQIGKEFETGNSTHDLTIGAYYSAYKLDSFWNFNTVLTEVRGAPRLLDVLAVDAAGNELGALTDNGFLSYGDFGVDNRDDVKTWALYIADTWQVTDTLRIDAGFRHQRAEMTGALGNFETFDLGDPSTLADDTVSFRNGTFTPYDETFDGNGWTLGANYDISDTVAVFGRYSEVFRIPRTLQIWFDSARPVEDIEQFEAGVKVALDNFSLFGVFFYNEFGQVPFSNQVVNAQGEIETLQLFARSTTPGIEVEAVWRLFDDLVDLQFTGTFQQPEYDDFSFDEIDPVTNAVTRVDFSGNQIRRIPEVMLAFRPAYNFVAGDVTGRLYANIQFNGERFVDFANNTELPDYTTIDAGVLLDVTDEFTVQLHGSNLTNEVGLTEGNPRSGQVFGQAGAFIFGRPILGRAYRVSGTYRF